MVFFNFYVSHWEKYNTGVLYLPWGYDLSMWGSTAMYLLTWWYGYGFWKRDLPFGIALGNVLEVTLHISAMANTPMVIVNVYNSYTKRTGKMRPFKEAIRPLWPLLAFMIILLGWPFLSPNNIMDKDPRALFMLSGTIFSNISCRLIVSQMSNTRCEIFHWMTPIYILSIGFGIYVPRTERFILYALLLGTTLTHWHYGTNVVNQMCEHFHRICFSVKLRDPKEKNSETTKAAITNETNNKTSNPNKKILATSSPLITSTAARRTVNVTSPTLFSKGEIEEIDLDQFSLATPMMQTRAATSAAAAAATFNNYVNNTLKAE